MKKDPESIFKKGLRSVAASVPVAASLSQWWAEMDSDAQTEAIEELREQVSGLRNPIIACHPRAPELLAVFYKRIEETGESSWLVDVEMTEFLEVLNLWEKQGQVQVQHAIGNRFIRVSFCEPLFIMAIYNAVKGDAATAKLRHSVWRVIKCERKGVQGQPIADALGVSLLYVDALFQILEEEGKGWKSKTRGSSYFLPDPALCK